MATMFCALCERPVDARREIRAGTIIFGILTGGVSLLLVPFYRKRCSICRSTAVHKYRPREILNPVDPDVQAELERLDAELARPYRPSRWRV